MRGRGDDIFGGQCRERPERTYAEPFQQIDEESTLAQLRDGVSVLEKAYTDPDPDDHRVRLRKLSARPAKTIRYWFPNQDDELDRIVQIVWEPDETGTTGQFVQTDPILATTPRAAAS